MGQLKGGSCWTSADCNPGLRCDVDNGQCADQIKIGDKTCNSDYDCVNNAICSYSNPKNVTQGGECKEYFSVKNGKTVPSCDMTTYSNFACDSGFCAPSENGGTYICADPPSLPSFPRSCDKDSDCIGSTKVDGHTVKFNSACFCTMSGKADQTCQPLTGDSAYSNCVFAFLKQAFTSKAYLDCNSSGRHSDSCLKRVLPSQTYKDYRAGLIQYKDWATVNNRIKCSTGIYNVDYTDANGYCDPYSHSSGDDGDDDSDDFSLFGLVQASLLMLLITY
jgi:hypothetical protein